MSMLVRRGSIAATAKVDASEYAPICLGLGMAQVFSGDLFFIDLSKHGTWRINSTTTLVPEADKLNGDPFRITSGNRVGVFINGDVSVDIDGTYYLRWSSSLDLTLSQTTTTGTIAISDQTWSSGTGEGSATITLSGGVSDFWINWARPDNTTGDLPGFGSVKMINTKTYANGKTGLEMDAEGKVWNPDLLDKFRNIPTRRGNKRALMARFMDPNRVNNWIDTATSADVTEREGVSWGGKMPPDVIVEFAERVRPKYCWVCFPVAADQSYRLAYMAKLNACKDTIWVLEHANEVDWNFAAGFGQWQMQNILGSKMLYDGGDTSIVSVTGTGTSGQTINVGTTAASALSVGERIGILETNKWQTITAIDAGAGIVTHDGTNGINGTTGTIYAGASNDDVGDEFHIKTQGDILDDAIATFDNRADFLSAFGIQQAGALRDVYKVPVRMEAAGIAYRPVSDHDIISPSSYILNPKIGLSYVTEYFEGSQATALSNFQTAVLNTINTTLKNNMTNLRADLDEFAPDMMIMAYEGGWHMLDGTISDSGWGAYTVDDAVTVFEAWRNDATHQAEAVAAWMDAQRVGMVAATQFLVSGKVDSDGMWGLYNLPDLVSDEFTSAVLAEVYEKSLASFSNPRLDGMP
ncbi:hypothetical protein [Pseudooceanicola nitratireducens]|uniref:hypothetical protein n=1 Tax=Pseudooceanicola nitratireducens TaxID=517719 RepID=UPI003C79B472